MTYILSSELYRYSFEAYEEMMDGISRAIAEGDVKNELIDRRAEAIDNFTDKLVASGKVSQQDMMELETLSSQETFLNSHGVAIEHFTRIPSRTNFKIALEMSDLLKGGLIGVAVAVGGYILWKLFKWIWDFFTKKETAEQRAAKTAEKWIKDLKGKGSELAQFSKEETDEFVAIAAKVLNLEEGFTWQLTQIPENKYTVLMHKVFTENGAVTNEILAAFDSMNVHQSIMVEAKKVVDLYPGAGGSDITAEEMNKYITDVIEPLLASERIKDLNAFHDKYDELLTNAKEWSKQTQPLEAKTVQDFIRLLTNPCWETVFNKIRDKQNLDVYGKLIQDSEKDFSKFKDNAKKFENQDTKGMSDEEKKAATAKVKDMFAVYQKCVKGFANLMGVYILIQSQYHGFLQGALDRWKQDASNIKKVAQYYRGKENKMIEQLKKDWKLDADD